MSKPSHEYCKECNDWNGNISKCMEICGIPIDIINEWEKYRAIGTVEECRAAVENHSEKKVFVVVQGNYALSKNMDAFSTRELADGFRKHIRKESNFNGCINVFELEVDGAVLKEEDM